MKTSWPKIAFLVLCCVALAFEVRHFRSTQAPALHLSAANQKNKPDFVLLPASEIPRAIGYFVYPKPHAESWEPTLGDMEDVEANLSEIPALSRLDPNPSARIEDPHKYFRQYLAVVVNGKRTIFLNAFCTDQGHANDWRSHVVFVFDGGHCFWHATYDPAKAKFSELKVNGLG